MQAARWERLPYARLLCRSAAALWAGLPRLLYSDATFVLKGPPRTCC